jgi:hypothetical protein
LQLVVAFLRLFFALANLETFINLKVDSAVSDSRLLFSTRRLLIRTLMNFPSHQIQLWAFQTLCKYPSASIVDVSSFLNHFAQISDSTEDVLLRLLSSSISPEYKSCITIETSSYLRKQLQQELLSPQALFSILKPAVCFTSKDINQMAMGSPFYFLSGALILILKFYYFFNFILLHFVFCQVITLIYLFTYFYCILLSVKLFFHFFNFYFIF